MVLRGVAGRLSERCEPVQITLARLDERIKAITRDSIEQDARDRYERERSETDRDKAIKLASDELARRLTDLNHAHQQAVEVQATYVPRETFEASLKETIGRLNHLEGDAREQRGRLWLPMLAAAGIAAALATGAVSLIFQR